MTNWTIQKVLEFAAQDFKERGFQSPRLEAEILLSHILECPRLKLYTDFDRPLMETERSAYRNAISRRRSGEPAAYIIGKKEFWSMEFEVNPKVLIPRPETEILVEHASMRLEDHGKVLDLCTGTGCVAIALAKEFPEIQVDAVDISDEACLVAKRNALTHRVSHQINFFVGDLYEPLPPEKGYDLITANPPYVRDLDMENLSTEVKWEPGLALVAGPDGLDVIRAIVAKARLFLKPGGWLLMEIDPRQTKKIMAIIENPAPENTEHFEIFKDLAGKERIFAWQVTQGSDNEQATLT